MTGTSSEWKRVQDGWQVFRPRVAAYWTRLGAEDLDHVQGDRASLVALVKKHYALATSEAEAQVDTWLAGIAREMGTPALEDPSTPAPPPARSKEEQRAEGEGMGVVPGATSPSEH